MEQYGEQFRARSSDPGSHISVPRRGPLVRPQDIVAAIFLICEGQGRGRYNEISRWEWFVPVLGTSNDSVAELLARAREPPDRAAFDRLIDVPLPKGKFGVFENLHSSDTIGDFVLRLKSAQSECICCPWTRASLIDVMSGIQGTSLR